MNWKRLIPFAIAVVVLGGAWIWLGTAHFTVAVVTFFLGVWFKATKRWKSVKKLIRG